MSRRDTFSRPAEHVNINWKGYYIVDNTTPFVLFYSAEFLPVVAGIRTAGTLYAQVDQGELPDWAVPYVEFMDGGEITTPDKLPAPEDPVYIVHTSGTTGNPKGAVLGQSAQYGTAQVIVEELPRLATGKVDKVRLRAPYWQGRQTQIT